TTSCSVKRSADRCVAPNGGSTCSAPVPSCCDACVSGGCLTTTTTTSSTSTTTITSLPPCGLDAGGTCSGLCPNLSDVCVQDSTAGACGCVQGPCRAFGGIGSCAGSCPPPALCTFAPVPGGCTCIIPCEGSGAPPCSPPCSFPQACIFDPSAG